MPAPLVAVAARRYGPRVIAVLLPLVLVVAFTFVTVFVVILGGGTASPQECVMPPGTPAGTRVEDLSEEQRSNAQVIADVAAESGAGEYGAVVGIAAAWQESRLRNLDHGDRDSQGMFQQRPASGWGSVAEIRDPVKATQAFFGVAEHTRNAGLLDVPGWQSLTVGEAAQTVQRSADPTGDWYQQWEGLARKALVSLDADSGLAVESVRDDVTGATGLAPDDVLCGVGTAMTCPPTPWPEVEEGLTPDALRVLRCVHQQFPQVETFHGIGERPTETSDHPSGRAVDAMIPDYETAGSGGVRLKVASYNVLGHSHTRRGGDRCCRWADARTRMGWSYEAIEDAGIDVVGLQELQPLQVRELLRLGEGEWAVTRAGRANRVAWRRDVFAKVEERTIGIPYFHGKVKQMPYVLLEHRDSGERVWVASFHNPADAFGKAQQWRDAAERKEAALAAQLSADGTPVIFTGDMNDRRGYFCDTVRNAPLHAANGGSPGVVATAATCQPPADMGIDWIMGSTAVGFDGYRSDERGRLARASDHPLVHATATLGGTGQGLGDQVAAWVRTNHEGLGVRYVIWDDRIWSRDKADQGWRPYDEMAGCGDRSDSCRHLDHVHVSVFGSSAGGTTPAGPWTLPTRGYTLTARFGECSAHWASCHTGLDFAAPTGTPVFAASDGVVLSTSWGGAYGNLTKIRHGDGTETWYAHQSSQVVESGQRVKGGQVIGSVGSTGNSTGPHLHYEVRTGGAPIDPLNFLTEQGVTP